MSTFFADRAFRLDYNSTRNNLQAHASLRFYAGATSMLLLLLLLLVLLSLLLLLEKCVYSGTVA